MTSDGDLLLEEFHEAGIWLPGEALDTVEGQNERDLTVRHLASNQGNRYLKAMGMKEPSDALIETDHGFHQPVREGPIEAPWNLHPSSGPGWLVLRHLYCRPHIRWALIAAIIGLILAWPW